MCKKIFLYFTGENTELKNIKNNYKRYLYEGTDISQDIFYCCVDIFKNIIKKSENFNDETIEKKILEYNFKIRDDETFLKEDYDNIRDSYNIYINNKDKYISIGKVLVSPKTFFDGIALDASKFRIYYNMNA